MTKRYLRAWLVLLVCLLVTGYASYSIKSAIDAEAQRQFAVDCDEIQIKIAARLEAHKQVLLGAAAFFDASGSIERDGWRAYAKRMQIDQHFNGIQGLGFSLLIPKHQLDSHIAAIRKQGFPEYTVRPVGERDTYSSIIYLEPFAGRNLMAFGYDMYSEPVRRAAMEQARDENTAVLSDKVRLVQETGQNVQAGTLMYLPVYSKTMPIETLAQRRAALYGWVYSPFRMGDLLGGVLQGADKHAAPHLHLQVYDGRSANADKLLYDSAAGAKIPASALFTLERQMRLFGNEWTLRFAQIKGSTSGPDYSKAWITLAGGSVASLLLFLLMLSYLDTRRNAERIAAKLMIELRNSEARLQTIVENLSEGVAVSDFDGQLLHFNRVALDMHGFATLEQCRQHLSKFADSFEVSALDGTVLPVEQWALARVLRGGEVHGLELRVRHIQAGWHKIFNYSGAVVRDADGQPLLAVLTISDITERKRMETGLQESEARYKRITDGLTDYLYTVRIENGRAVETTHGLACVAVTGYTAEEFAANPNLWIQMVVPEDRDLVLEYTRQILAGQDGTPIAHRITRKNGEIRWISDAAIPFRDASGKLLSYDGVIRDITERKQAEQEQRQSAAINTALAELSRFFLSTEQVEIEDLSAQVLDRARQLTGSEFGYVGYIDTASGFLVSPTLTRDIWERCKVAGKAVAFEKWGGLWGWVLNNKKSLLSNAPSADPRSGGIPQGHVPIANLLSVPALAGEQLMGQISLANAAHDYTERDREIVERLADFYAIVVQRMRSEAMLCESEERLRLFVQYAPSAIAMFDRDMRYIAFSHRWLADYHLGEQELAGRSHYEVFPDLPERWKEIHRRCLAGAIEKCDEDPFPRADGFTDWVRWEVRPWRTNGNNVGGIIIFSEVITARKQAEIAIQHANRALFTLSAVNRTLVRATDENELMQAICQATVEQKGYRMAWVGYKQQDEGKSIKIMAHAGQEEGYLDTMQPTWAETERGMCPCGCAIRSGTTQLCQDIAHDSQYLPWRDAALERGYAANIALSLTHRNGKVFGILSVYAAEVNAFTAAEIALLEEMAADLAFGVRSLRVRSERDLALAKNQEHLAQLQDSLEDTVRAIATIVEMRDPYTAGHQARVADLAMSIAKQMGLPEEQVHAIHLAGVVHDLGKIKIPAEILSKPGKITDIEFSLIKIHPQAGYDILKGIQFPWPIAQMVLQHHERLDGSGYPQGLKGDDILLEARILSVADVVEAMYSHRPYRPGLGIEVALAEITKQCGVHYDSQVVDACLTLFREQHYSFKS